MASVGQVMTWSNQEMALPHKKTIKLVPSCSEAKDTACDSSLDPHCSLKSELYYLPMTIEGTGILRD